MIVRTSIVAISLLALAACGQGSKSPSKSGAAADGIQGSASAGGAVAAKQRGIANPANAPELTALLDEVRKCWDTNTSDAACPPIAKVVALAAADATRAPKLYDTLVNWIEEPSDWHIRQFAAFMLNGPITLKGARTNSAVLGRILTALKNEPAATQPRQAAQTAMQLAQLAVGYANAGAGHEATLVALVNDKTYAHPSARVEFIKLLDPKVGAGRIPMLLAIATDAHDDELVRDSAIGALGHVGEGDRAKVIEALTLIVQSDPSEKMARSSIQALAWSAGSAAIPVIMETVEKRATNGIAHAAAVALVQLASRTAQGGVDAKPIVEAALKIVNNESAGREARVYALRALKWANDSGFKPTADRLVRGRDALLATLVQQMLAEK